jgi:phosphomannomutase
MEGVGKELAGKQIARVSSEDGKKFVLEDGSWVLARASGTEPIIRVYVEATSEARVDELLTAFSSVLGID